MQRKEVRLKICMRKWNMEKQWTFPWKKLLKLLQRGLEKSTICMSLKPQLVSFQSNGLEDVNTSPFTVDDKDSKILSETQFTMVTFSYSLDSMTFASSCLNVKNLSCFFNKQWWNFNEYILCKPQKLLALNHTCWGHKWIQIWSLLHLRMEISKVLLWNRRIFYIHF